LLCRFFWYTVFETGAEKRREMGSRQGWPYGGRRGVLIAEVGSNRRGT
jgi:hypothetical protein